MNQQIVALHETLNLNTRLFRNCLDGVDDETAQKRPEGTVNSMAFIALHMVDARYYLARVVGQEATSPFEELTKDANRIEDLSRMPALEELRVAWDAISAVLGERLTTLTQDELDEEVSQPFPVQDRTRRGTLAFLIHHDSYHLGQLAFLRKQLGLGAMSYG
jgi:uncharacterized damage-inducible protein DinB